MSAAILITTEGDAICAFDYCRSAVDEIKRLVPASARAWIPDRKQWIVKAPFVPVVTEILEDIFGQVHVTDERAPRATVAASDAFTVLHLMPTAPPELVTAAHKCLAKLNHPDRGGDTAQMQELNEAYTALQAGGPL